MDIVERVARAIDPGSARVVDMLIEHGASRAGTLALLPLDKARDAIEAIAAFGIETRTVRRSDGEDCIVFTTRHPTSPP